MAESAISGARERRKAETSFRITEAARRLTAANGVHGFTVERLCDEVGISRRTFFNYFRTKDDAIIGLAEDALDDEAVRHFVDSGRSAGAPSPGLLDALVELTIAHLRLIRVDREQAGAFAAAISREPHLLHRMMSAGGEREKRIVALVEQREGLPSGDRRAELAVLLLDGMVRSSWVRFVAPGNTASIEDLLLDALDAARSLKTVL